MKKVFKILGLLVVFSFMTIYGFFVFKPFKTSGSQEVKGAIYDKI